MPVLLLQEMKRNEKPGHGGPGNKKTHIHPQISESDQRLKPDQKLIGSGLKGGLG